MKENEPSERIQQRIVIHTTTGKTGSKLDKCYFLATDFPGVYNFFNQHGELLARDVFSRKKFGFKLDGLHWEITDFEIDGFDATGDWKNDAALPGIAQDGTFQAQSGGGVSTEDSYGEPVSVVDPPANAITIETVTGGADKDKLKKCYFLPGGAPGEYNLYSKHGTELASGLTSGTNFNFPHDSITWTVTNFLIDDTNASGNWSDPDEITGAQDGTFQAQSGGGVDTGESASAASAS